MEGNLYGKNITIRGQVKGKINATGRVDIAQEAIFSGKITAKSVSVKKGAHFDADVDLGRKPLDKAASEKSSKVVEQTDDPKVE